MPHFIFFLDIFSQENYNFFMEVYHVRKVNPTNELLEANAPASKSLLNRALILAAFGKGDTFLSCGNFADDTNSMLHCLSTLGIQWEQQADGILVHGCNHVVPNPTATLNVCSAGTAARFLTVALAFAGGKYTMTSSEQMKRRPMEILSILEQVGVRIEYLEERGHFPFILTSNGIRSDELSINTDLSTQYASGILLAAATIKPMKVRLTGTRTQGSYITMTLRLMEKFGAQWSRSQDEISVIPSERNPEHVEIEADLSGACYFYALSLLLGMRIIVPRVHFDTLQGDIAFLRLLESKGVRLTDTPKGIVADGSNVTSFPGFDVNMQDFSDQALTVAAMAPFASSETHITGIAHARKQECDRIHAIVYNLKKLGIKAIEETDGARIFPGSPTPASIATFDDHRVAMAFSLVGLKVGNVDIENPLCCRKTFADYFNLLDRLFPASQE